VGALDVFAYALIACATLRRTGSLWFALGFHAAANWAQTFLFSVADSGTGGAGQLLHSSLQGPTWLTGGAVGPEASVIDFIVLALLLLAFLRLYPAAQSRPSARSTFDIRLSTS
jgi:hypothetical protein